ncbi:MAG TPA: efflux transporter outer membrane subunit [Gemmatimonadaceae bacterium]|jgi:NodT family efflux transporter outer membrane factor (OMF) lipoprotein
MLKLSSHFIIMATLIVAACAGCAGAPAYQAPTVAIAPSYPATQSAQLRPAVTSEPFWQEIGDSTLSALVAEALRNGTDVHIAQARLDATRASRRLVSYDLAPTVTAVGSALRSQQSLAAVPGLANRLPQQDLYDFGFDASWELDVFGRVRRNVAAQNALTSVAEHSLEDVQVSLAAEVARTYFELRGAQRQLGVALRNADVQRKTLALTEDRLAAGRGAGFDVERARSVLQLTLASVPGLNAQIAAHRNRISTLLGRAPEAVPVELLTAAPLPSLPDSVTVGSPRQLIRRRPDVLAAERAVAAQSLFVGSAQADYMPRLAVGASLGYTSNRVASLTDNNMSRVLFGPSVTFPLLDLGRVKERVNFAQAGQREAQAEYTSTVLRALEETETAVTSYDRAHERLALLTDAVKSSSKALDLAQQRFEAGLTDFLQVLDAQRTLLDAENQLATAHVQAGTALVALYKAAGGTWSVRQ